MECAMSGNVGTDHPAASAPGEVSGDAALPDGAAIGTGVAGRDQPTDHVALPCREPEIIPPDHASRSDAAVTGGRAIVAIDSPTAPPSRLGGIRRAALGVAIAAAFVFGAYYGWSYWTVGRFLVSTDDAYVKADNTTIAPKISGYVAAVAVNDNQQVAAGDTLVRIDDRDFRVALDQATADVEAAQAALTTRQAQLSAQQSIIESARETVKLDRANLTFAEQDDARYSKLASTGSGSVQNAQQASSRADVARAAMARDSQVLATATRQLDVL
jgi:membrane fusion protein (multidrug efflux system)